MHAIRERIEQKVGVPNIANLLAQSLSATDLQSLLLEVYRQRAKDKTPADVLRDYKQNRFVRPANVHPQDLHNVEDVFYAQIPDAFELLALSPVAPLGTNSVAASVDQNWTVTTIRNTEVISDATNVLALECATRRQATTKTKGTNLEAVHLAASHRFLRPQFYDKPAFLPHFHMMSLCSAGRDQGNLGFELASFLMHLEYYLASVQKIVDGSITLAVYITDFHETDRSSFLEKGLLHPLSSKFPQVSIGFDPERVSGKRYYRDLCFHIYANPDTDEVMQLADGGSVDWTQKYLSNKKERLVISGISSERLCSLRRNAQN